MAFSSAFKKRKIDAPPVSNVSLLTLLPQTKIDTEFVSAENQTIPEKSNIFKNAEKTSWEEFARPLNLNDVKGQEEGKKIFLEWLENPMKPILICGPSGCGKTSLIRTCLHSLNYWIWDESFLAENDTLGEAIKHFKSTSGFKKTAIVIECIEGIHPEERKGLISAIDIKNSTKIPIIFTADDDFHKSVKPLKKKCTFLKLKKLDSNISKKLLIEIANKNNNSLSPDSAGTLLDAAQGNLRQAINSMQFMILTKHREKKTTKSALNDCDDKFDIFNITRQVCSGIWNNDLENLIQTDLDFFLCMGQENVASSARTLKAAAESLDALSLSNILLSQIEIDSSRMTKEHFEFSGYIGGHSISLACQNSKNFPNIKFMTFFKVKQNAQVRKKIISDSSNCSILSIHDYFYFKREKQKQKKEKLPKELAKLLKDGLFDEKYIKEY